MEKVVESKRKLRKNSAIFLLSLGITAVLVMILFSLHAYGAAPSVSIDLAAADGSTGAMGTLEVLFLLVVLALMPSILMMMTSFTRIVIVLSFLRSALGTQQSPPNQIIIGMALFLSLFVMSPVIKDINTQAYQPYKSGEITQEQAIDNAVVPLKVFMLKQTQNKDLNMFMEMSNTETPTDADGNTELTELSLTVIVPSFMTSELKRAFTMGFLLFLPFLIIDMVVASTLMSMGMVMLPPAMIALPFKLMMFVLVDGWGLLFSTLVRSFR